LPYQLSLALVRVEQRDIGNKDGGNFMPFKWNLRMTMAQRGIWTGSELRLLLLEKAGLNISAAGISRLMQEEQTEVKLRVIDALCIVLDCKPEDLLILRTEVTEQQKNRINNNN
jgi:putative transcriptional regulator